MSEPFALDEELNNLQTDSIHIANEIPIEGENPKTLDRILNGIVDTIQETSYSITDPTTFDQIRSFINTATKVWDIVLSGFNSEIVLTAQDLDLNDQDEYLEHRQPLETYGFLILWIISLTEQKATSRAVQQEKAAGKATRGKGSRAAKDSADQEEGVTTWIAEKQRAMDLMTGLLDQHLSKIWTSTHEKETFVSLFYKPAYQLLENRENVKIAALKKRAYRVLCLCIKRHNHEFGAKTTILQNLQYWEHTPEPMAELLEMLSSEYDFPQLVEGILRDVASKEFDEAIKDLSVPRAYSKFLVKLSELAPKLVLKQMGLLIQHLDGESYMMRQAIVEIIGNLIAYLSEVEQTDQVKNQIDGFFDVLEERFMDNNSYVRTKLLQIIASLCDLRTKFPKRRQRLTELVIGRLSDKSFWSRKQAIKTLVRLIENHPYSMHGGELDLEGWEIRYTEVTDDLKAMVTRPSRRRAALKASAGEEGDMDIDRVEPEAGAEDDAEDIALPTDEELLELQASKEYITKTLQQRYYADAIRFIHLIHRGVPVMCELLASTTKQEVIEAMEFFVAIHRYKVRSASEGIRKMVHLVWMKDNNDEAKGVRTRLVECYWQIYLAPEESLTEKENTAVIARNLVSLTYNSTLAELTSLEQLLTVIVTDSLTGSNDISISDEVVEKLWQVYSHHKDIPNPQRRGAIIILGMLAKAKPDIVANKIETILRIGLGKHGRADLALARYSCIALQRIAGEKKKQKGMIAQDTVRLPIDHPIFLRLRNLIDTPTTSKNWFAVAEQVLNTIYLLSEHPDSLCGDIIKTRCKSIFNLMESMDSPDTMSIDVPSTPLPEDSTINPENAFKVDSWHLSQIIFIVGHVAIKHIVHMEVIEEEFKRRKAGQGADGKKAVVDDELDQVVGTTEDEFGDAMAHIRERELLFGEDSLLQVFGPLIITICGNNTLYSDKTLQSSATLALCKLMCISAEFCEHNLQLLFTILEKSTQPAIRSNIIIALGDMAVCFNNLIDANINYLYKRLSDSDKAVKKNTLMVLTHLILNGMVKVKGQLGEMAICLTDEDNRISDLARLFFTELTSKDNAVYNNMPDIISHMSNSQISEESYRKIMKFLFELIKEKNMDSMIEKLCQRFKNTDQPRGWRDIAFCLSMLPFKTEKSFKRLLEGFPNYQDKVYEEQVFKSLTDIVTKGRQIKPPKPELKPIIDEFESKLQEYKAKGDEVQDTEAKAISAVKKGSRKGGRRALSTLVGLKIRNASIPEPTEEKHATRSSRRGAEQEEGEGEEKEEHGEGSRKSRSRRAKAAEEDDQDDEVEDADMDVDTEKQVAPDSQSRSQRQQGRSSRTKAKDEDGDTVMGEDGEGNEAGEEEESRDIFFDLSSESAPKRKTTKAPAKAASKAKAAASKAAEGRNNNKSNKASPRKKGKSRKSWSDEEEEEEEEQDFDNSDEDEDVGVESDEDSEGETPMGRRKPAAKAAKAAKEAKPVKATKKKSVRKVSEDEEEEEEEEEEEATPPPPTRSRRAAASKARRIVEESEEEEDDSDDYV
ncbi:Condensin complex subunit [Linnemannia exigua]|uniref:Condensin complex subunit n=1 Tax=Linnemannia exigua TaxID=604196 RepID=A0AAD4DHA3_9FUNG|nr:Condensin complex subunit [Linnemannia exigua]